MCLFEVSVRKANAEISAEQDGCTSEQVRVVFCTCERVVQHNFMDVTKRDI